ncbi:MAG: NAD kinase [Pseudomonadota bacterium]
MLSRFKHVALVGKYRATGIGDVLARIADFLKAQGIKVALERETALDTGLACDEVLTPLELGQRCDLVVVVGGDGTMLGIARQMAPFGVPLVGINQGRLGFMTDVPLESLEATLIPLLAGDYEEERRTMLEGQVTRQGELIFEGLAMNDVVVSRGATASMVELKVDIGNSFVANMRADGLIVSSPTGSTAYALSAGGPILHPEIAAWVLVPIAPHDLSNRPIVLPDSGTIDIEIVAGRDASVNFDMQSLASLLHGDRISVRRSAHQVRFLHPLGWNYYATLRRKLHWHAGTP